MPVCLGATYSGSMTSGGHRTDATWTATLRGTHEQTRCAHARILHFRRRAYLFDHILLHCSPSVPTSFRYLPTFQQDARLAPYGAYRLLRGACAVAHIRPPLPCLPSLLRRRHSVPHYSARAVQGTVRGLGITKNAGHAVNSMVRSIGDAYQQQRRGRREKARHGPVSPTASDVTGSLSAAHAAVLHLCDACWTRHGHNLSITRGSALDHRRIGGQAREYPISI